jgi:hypothetical protein
MAKGGTRAAAENPPRTRPTATLAEAARELTAEALQTLVDIMHDSSATAAARAACANAILDRGWGKATQQVDAAEAPATAASPADGEPSGLVGTLAAIRQARKARP